MLLAIISLREQMTSCQRRYICGSREKKSNEKNMLCFSSIRNSIRPQHIVQELQFQRGHRSVFWRWTVSWIGKIHSSQAFFSPHNRKQQIGQRKLFTSNGQFKYALNVDAGVELGSRDEPESVSMWLTLRLFGFEKKKKKRLKLYSDKIHSKTIGASFFSFFLATESEKMIAISTGREEWHGNNGITQGKQLKSI